MADFVALAAPPRRARLTFPTALRHALNLSPMVLVHAGALAVFFTAGSTTEWLLLPLLAYAR